jgi:hypothetical protein
MQLEVLGIMFTTTSLHILETRLLFKKGRDFRDTFPVFACSTLLM